MKRIERYPVSPIERLKIIYCGARTRASGTCRQPAMKNGRCRLHGGKSKSGAEHGRYIHGMRSREFQAYKKRVRELMKDAKGLIRLSDLPDTLM